MRHATLIAAILLLPLALGGCASVPDGSSQWIAPSDAVQLAAAAAPRAVRGQFHLRVQNTGSQNGNVYLNSERDYRDQRNLTVTLTPHAIEQYTRLTGQDPLQAFRNQDIVVSGAAARVRIGFFIDGKPSDKYYYQTQLVVDDTSQIRVLTR